MNINKNLTSNPLGIVNAFNAYFSSVAENLIIKNFFGKNAMKNNDPLIYLRQNFSHSISSIRLNNTTTHEIEK
jgi:hypothetical protein